MPGTASSAPHDRKEDAIPELAEDVTHEAIKADIEVEVPACNFEVGDSQWHCIHSPMPSPWLCAIPWPACCSEAYTVCQ